jgi:hypothetical protein
MAAAEEGKEAEASEFDGLADVPASAVQLAKGLAM